MQAPRRGRELGAPQWLFRAALVLLGGAQLATGIWATTDPSSFYTRFPFGRGWVEALPAYNEHLTRDVGAFFLATGFLLLAAAWIADRRLVAIALITYLVFSIPHTAYHLDHLDVYGTGDAIANVIALGATVLLPLALLALLARGGRRAGP